MSKEAKHRPFKITFKSVYYHHIFPPCRSSQNSIHISLPQLSKKTKQLLILRVAFDQIQLLLPPSKPKMRSSIPTSFGGMDPTTQKTRATGATYRNTRMLLLSAPCPSSCLSHQSMLAPGVPQLMEEFHSDNDELASFVVSVYVIGFALGPMVLAPMSEVYGRVPVYYACNVLFTIFSVACTVSSNLGMLIGFRLLAGCAGSAPLSNGGGTISDLIIQEKRGASLSFYAMGPLLGPTLGPVAGGYLALAKGWRWSFWVIAIAVSIVLV
jgi:multidrug resistance protein